MRPQPRLRRHATEDGPECKEHAGSEHAVSQYDVACVQATSH
jgi:hypothetical protein